MPADTPEQLRQRLRRARAKIEPAVIEKNALALQLAVETLDPYRQAVHVAAYIAIRGEMDLTPLMGAGAKTGKQFYLPILRSECMHFAPWSPGEPLCQRGFGLLEPDVAESDWRAAADLDLVLAPLVVFDQRCNRIGQGGGYYDRTFEFRKGNSDKPILIGVAHDCQRVQQLQPETWDVPLDWVVTEVAGYRNPDR